MSEIFFLPIGGGGEIGANSYYLNIDGCGIILDCGLHPQKSGLEALPDFSLIRDKNVDYVLISHAHQDHLSGLPFLVKEFPHVKVITTPQTRAIAELTLHNSLSILEEQISSEEFKIFSHEEVDILIQFIGYQEYNKEFTLERYNGSGSPITCTFFNAGHILGSAAILLKYEDKQILYTGDISFRNQKIMKKADIKVKNLDWLITETTYGSTDTNIFNWKQEEKRFTSAANRILSDGGSILIPSFSLGKNQEMLALLNDLMENNRLATCPIYSDGLGDKISRIYDYNRFVVDYQDTELILSRIPHGKLYRIRRVETLFKEPCIVLAASGMMMPRTASFALARRWLNERRSAIFTVGYMDPETPGFTVAKAKPGDKIKLPGSENEFEVKCTIKNFRFPSHALRDDLLDFVKTINPKNVILIHGDDESMNWIGENILNLKLKTKVYKAELGNTISFTA